MWELLQFTLDNICVLGCHQKQWKIWLERIAAANMEWQTLFWLLTHAAQFALAWRWALLSATLDRPWSPKPVDQNPCNRHCAIASRWRRWTEACWRCSSSCFCKSSPTLDIRLRRAMLYILAAASCLNVQHGQTQVWSSIWLSPWLDWLPELGLPAGSEESSLAYLCNLGGWVEDTAKLSEPGLQPRCVSFIRSSVNFPLARFEKILSDLWLFGFIPVRVLRVVDKGILCSSWVPAPDWPISWSMTARRAD